MNYLPIGSVVTLKNSYERLIIIGVNQKSKENGEKYDYAACLYPYGYLDGNELFLFNNEKIKKVHFKGFFDDEMKDYYEDIEWVNKGGKDE